MVLLIAALVTFPGLLAFEPDGDAAADSDTARGEAPATESAGGENEPAAAASVETAQAAPRNRGLFSAIAQGVFKKGKAIVQNMADIRTSSRKAQRKLEPATEVCSRLRPAFHLKWQIGSAYRLISSLCC